MSSETRRAKYYILRTSQALKLTFYTGRVSMLIGELWTPERAKAHVVFDTYAGALKRAEQIALGHPKSVVGVIPHAMLDAIVAWNHEERARDRRLYRQQKQLSRREQAAAKLAGQAVP